MLEETSTRPLRMVLQTAILVCFSLSLSRLAYSACDPNLLKQLLDKGFSQEQILQLCGTLSPADGQKSSSLDNPAPSLVEEDNFAGRWRVVKVSTKPTKDVVPPSPINFYANIEIQKDDVRISRIIKDNFGKEKLVNACKDIKDVQNREKELSFICPFSGIPQDTYFQGDYQEGWLKVSLKLVQPNLARGEWEQQVFFPHARHPSLNKYSDYGVITMERIVSGQGEK